MTQGVGGHSDGWSLMEMDRSGRSAGRFSIHSAMASFMKGTSSGPPGGTLAGASGTEKPRPELGPLLGIMSLVRQVLKAGWPPLAFRLAEDT